MYIFPTKKLFISMDECLVKHDPSLPWEKFRKKFDSDEYFYQIAPHGKGSEAFRIMNYFWSNVPYESVAKMIELLAEEEKIDVYVINKYAPGLDPLVDRRAWLDEYTPFLKKRFFYPSNMAGPQFVKDITGTFDENCILIDSIYKNLLEWTQCGGTAIKLLNDSANDKDCWEGNTILSELMAPGEMADYVMKTGFYEPAPKMPNTEIS